MDFLVFVLIDAISHVGIASRAFVNQSLRYQLSEGGFHMRDLPRNMSFQQPPFNNACESILSLGMLNQVRQNLIDEW